MLNISKSSIWLPPTPNVMKINVDISFISADMPITIGYLLRYSNGKLISAGTKVGSAATPREAECEGLLAAAQWGLNQQLKAVHLEADSKPAVDYLNGSTTWNIT
ncbi:hypothetical protein FRX31_033698 [Thalictrum thalictroides]|uniref:RNase H type-1 domain-containing protein n=1 Tax=Thalictrum thalictroides TaxID=46969 RepID=A0A7J6UVZ4_THATH|nr:hypothetical protein FRX31_033698 [Thalictrum thalictroides]